MRVFIVASDEPVYLVPYVRQVIASCRSMIAGVGVHTPAPKALKVRRALSLALLALLIMTPRQWLQMVAWRVKDFFAALGLVRTHHHLADVCRELGVPVHDVPSVNAPAFVNYLREQQIDVLLHQTPEILREPVLGAPRIAVINRHLSLLPAYRGAWPIFWQFANRESSVGVTIHMVDRGIDTGEIIAQAELPLARQATIAGAVAQLFERSAPLTCEALQRLAAGQPRQPNAGTMPAFRTPSPIELLRYLIGLPVRAPQR